MGRLRSIGTWLVLVALAGVPMVVSARSPLLEWREPVYILAGFTGVLGLAILLFQPLLAGGILPGLGVLQGRRVHRVVGALLVSSVFIHVVGLWITSPPDVIDALLFRSPTPFAAWGVVAMWGVFGAAALAILRKRLRARTWRRLHSAVAVAVVVSSVAHALMIQGTMGTISKTVLCVAVIAALVRVLVKLRAWRLVWSGRGKLREAPRD